MFGWRVLTISILALVMAGAAGCEDGEDSDAAYARQVATASSAVRKNPIPPGDDLQCRAIVLDSVTCVSSLGTEIESYYFAHFEGRTLSVVWVGGNAESSGPSNGAFDCEGDDRDRCIEYARKSGDQFQLDAPDGPLGKQIRSSPTGAAKTEACSSQELEKLQRATGHKLGPGQGCAKATVTDVMPSNP